MSMLGVSFRRLAVAVVVTGFVGLGPSPVQADTTIALGDGVSLAYGSGALDPITLEGSATFVRILVDDRQVALVLSLRLATRGALVDPDFTITELDARSIITSNAKTLIGEATGRDLMVGMLGKLARALDRRRNRDGAVVAGIFDTITIGELTLRRVTQVIRPTEIIAERVRLLDVADGRAAVMEIDGAKLVGADGESRFRIASTRIEGFSLDDSTYDGVVATDVTVAKEDFGITIGAMGYQTETAYLPDGMAYAPWSSISLDNISLESGTGSSAADPGRTEKAGEIFSGLKITIHTSTRPEGGSFVVAYQVGLNEETGDAVTLSARMQVPVTSWQSIEKMILTTPHKATDRLLPLVSSALLINGAIELSAPARTDSAGAVSARDRSGDRKVPVPTIAQTAAGLLSTLPGSKFFRDAVSAFMAKSGNLRILAQPVHPIPLNLLLDTKAPPRKLWKTLNIKSTHTAP